MLSFSRSIFFSSAPSSRQTSCAYTLFSRDERDTNPARYIGRVKASELDLEMTVLSRSKKAASTVHPWYPAPPDGLLSWAAEPGR
jgi:hypothetical protein